MKETAIAKYKALQDKRPDANNNLLMYIFRFGGRILFLLCIVIAARIYFTNDFSSSELRTSEDRLLTAIGLIAMSIPLFIISFLAKRIIKRNSYITDLETWAEESIKENAAVKNEDDQVVAV